ncbi:MAG: hypothetical protein E6X37_02560 [Veillonella parvula]|uniref:hypothetical protein n=1 Tax=Veillonella parvula TaxID=29466 RepID=UPI002907EA0E|nr:hypothetical protein [Veillonella parvula]MDU4965548.1 hypothetical protein [Veillonella parvula]
MEIKVLIDEKHKSTFIEYDETKHDKETVCAFLISALFNYTKELPAVERDILRLLYCETMAKGGIM